MNSIDRIHDFQVYPMRKISIPQILGVNISDLFDLASLTLRIHDQAVTPTEEENMTSIFKSLNGRIQCFKVEIKVNKMKTRKYLWPLLFSLYGIQRLGIEFQGGYSKYFIKNKNLAMISTYISKLINVTHLSLNASQCQIEAGDDTNFSLGIEKLEHLESLELLLDESSINPIQLLQVSQAIGKTLKLSSLVLRLKANNILDPRVCHLGCCISKLKQLTVLELNLENNKIQQFGMSYLLNVIAQLQQIKSINISLANNEINSKEIKDCEVIRNQDPLNCSQLKYLEVMKLNLEGNKLFDLGVESLIERLSTLPSLSKLDLNLKKTNFSISKDNKYEAHFSKLKNLQQLSLTLDDNELGDSIQFLQAGLSQFQQLTSFSLSISNNSLGIIGMKSISQVLPSFINLQSLNLRYNQNSLENSLELQYFQNSLVKLDMLEELTLQARECSLTDTQAKAIFIEISKLSNLRSLSLILLDNRIEEIGLQQLSMTIESLVQLNQLNIFFSTQIFNKDAPSQLIFSITKLQNLKTLTLLGLTKNNKLLFIKKKLKHLVQFCNLIKN